MILSVRKYWWGLVTGWMITAPVAAQDEFGLYETAINALPTGVPSPVAIVATIIQIVLGVVGAVAVILILFAGFQWMTAAGNEEKIGQAKKIIAGAIVGLVLIFSSYIIADFVFRGISTSVGVVPPGTSQVGQKCDVSNQCSADGSLVCDPINKTCQPPRTVCANDGLTCTSSCATGKSLGKLDCIDTFVCCLP